MFGVLMITLLLTIALVGSNMDIILKQGIKHDKEKIQSQEDIAQLRANVNLEKTDKAMRNKNIDLKETKIREKDK